MDAKDLAKWKTLDKLGQVEAKSLINMIKTQYPYLMAIIPSDRAKAYQREVGIEPRPNMTADELTREILYHKYGVDIVDTALTLLKIQSK